MMEMSTVFPLQVLCLSFFLGLCFSKVGLWEY